MGSIRATDATAGASRPVCDHRDTDRFLWPVLQAAREANMAEDLVERRPVEGGVAISTVPRRRTNLTSRSHPDAWAADRALARYASDRGRPSSAWSAQGSSRDDERSFVR